MGTYIANTAIKSGGKIHRPGEEFELDDALAAPLVVRGSVKPAPTPAPGLATADENTSAKTGETAPGETPAAAPTLTVEGKAPRQGAESPRAKDKKR